MTKHSFKNFSGIIAGLSVCAVGYLVLTSNGELGVNTGNIGELLTPNFVAKESFLGTEIVKLTDKDNNHFYTDQKSFIIKGGELINKTTAGANLVGNASENKYSKPSSSLTKDSTTPLDDSVISSAKLNEIYKAKLAELNTPLDVQKSPIEVPKIPALANQPKKTINKIPESNNSSKLADKSCYIPYGGFDQPKIAYSDKCELLSASDKKKKIKTMMELFPEEYFIKHKAENEKAQIYVFTDYTCGYCQRLHSKIDEFLAQGVSVNYVFFPRGMQSKAYFEQTKKVVDYMGYAWCSDDQVAAVDELYKNRRLPVVECKKEGHKLDSPVRQHYILGMMFEIEGTPLIVASNGNTTYGFKRVSTTLSNLGIK